MAEDVLSYRFFCQHVAYCTTKVTHLIFFQSFGLASTDNITGEKCDTSALKMEATGSAETLVTIYQTTEYKIPEDSYHHACVASST
jgi:hypothetical protein